MQTFPAPIGFDAEEPQRRTFRLHQGKITLSLARFRAFRGNGTKMEAKLLGAQFQECDDIRRSSHGALVRLNGVCRDDAHHRRSRREGAEEKDSGEESEQIATDHEAEFSRTATGILVCSA